ncbi:MAG: hypothetical protein HY817_05505 [Candidatus Abawacabacteria bacterium]|nr:hypothetical protein [Candidatus Abawacabacteria bacterium]
MHHRPGEDSLVQPVANTFLIDPISERILLGLHPNGDWQPIGGKGKSQEINGKQEIEDPVESALGEANEELLGLREFNLERDDFHELRHFRVARTGDKLGLAITRFLAALPLGYVPKIDHRHTDHTGLRWVGIEDHLVVRPSGGQPGLELKREVREDLWLLLRRSIETGTVVTATPHSQIVIKPVFYDPIRKAILLFTKDDQYALPHYPHDKKDEHIHYSFAEVLRRIMHGFPLDASLSDLRQKQLFVSSGISRKGKQTWMLFYLFYHPLVAVAYSDLSSAEYCWLPIDDEAAIEKYVVQRYQADVRQTISQIMAIHEGSSRDCLAQMANLLPMNLGERDSVAIKLR